MTIFTDVSLCTYVQEIQQLSNHLQIGQVFECDLHCCMNIFYLEVYGPAVISQAYTILKFYMIVYGQQMNNGHWFYNQWEFCIDTGINAILFYK